MNVKFSFSDGCLLGLVGVYRAVHANQQLGSRFKLTNNCRIHANNLCQIDSNVKAQQIICITHYDYFFLENFYGDSNESNLYE